MNDRICPHCGSSRVYTNIYERKLKDRTLIVEETRCDRCMHILHTKGIIKDGESDDHKRRRFK